MSVLLETSLGDIVIDLLIKEAPQACENFMNLCKLKYYNECLFYDVQKYNIAISGDPTKGGVKLDEVDGVVHPSSVYGIVSKDPNRRYFKD
jgi:peptidyl-prolyl cis-trans isomerase-like 4